MELLWLLVHEYEEKTLPINKPDQVTAIRFRMEQQGLIAPLLGSRSRVSEILSARRKLSLKMIRALVSGLHIPSDILIGRAEKAPDYPGEYTHLESLPKNHRSPV